MNKFEIVLDAIIHIIAIIACFMALFGSVTLESQFVLTLIVLVRQIPRVKSNDPLKKQ